MSEEKRRRKKNRGSRYGQFNKAKAKVCMEAKENKRLFSISQQQAMSSHFP